MNVSNSKCNLLPQLFLIKFHPDNLIGEPLVEKPVDLRPPTQLQSVHISTTASLNRPLKVILKPSHHLEHRFCLDRGVVWPAREGMTCAIAGVTKKHQKFIFEYWVVSQKSYLNMGHLKKSVFAYLKFDICIPKF